MKALFHLTVLAGLLAPGLSLAEEKKPDSEALQGTWQVISQQRAGRATFHPRNMLWIVEGETIWLVPGWLADEMGRQKAPEDKKTVEKGEGKTQKTDYSVTKARKQSGPPRGLRMTFHLDSAKAPKQIDIDGPKKGVHYGIYQLEGDDLILCMGGSQLSPSYGGKAKVDESTRPSTLSPEGGTVIVLKRVKK